jgi:hypothetical protein
MAAKDLEHLLGELRPQLVSLATASRTVAAEAGKGVAGANARAQQSGRAANQLVSQWPCVIHLLEVVEVEEQQCSAASVAA